MTRLLRTRRLTRLLALLCLPLLSACPDTDPPGNYAWEPISSLTGYTFVDISGSSADNIIVVGAGPNDSPYALRFDGAFWITEATDAAEALTAVWVVSRTRAYAAVDDGNVLRYSLQNGQGVWTPLPAREELFPGFPVHALWSRDGNPLYATGESVLITGDPDTVQIFTYNGSSWSSFSGNRDAFLYGMWGVSESNILAVGSHGSITRYNGATTIPEDSGTFARLRDVWMASASRAFAVGEDGTIIHHSGSAWSPMDSGVTVDLYGVWGTSATNVYAVGDGGTLLHYDGTAWTPQVSGTTANLRAVWGSSSTNVYAVGADATIVRYHDVGA